MKFSYKILIWTIIILAAAFGCGGYFFVNYVFETSLEREVRQAMDESSILQFAFETAALNIPSRYDMLQDSTVEEIGHNLERGGYQTGRLLRISDEKKESIYISDGFAENTELLQQLSQDTRIYQVIRSGERYYVQTGMMIHALDRILYLETMKDVTEVFEERAQGFLVYRRLTLVMLALSAVVMYFISSWLTGPIRLLTKATRKMAEGDYTFRAEQISNDEMGQLTCDFNKMASALEENIQELEEGVRAREDFIAAFSHELKTPLTAIIGYADLLRSRKLEEEQQFLSANYIYTEGRRLEAISLRLLDIIVTKRCDIELQEVDAGALFSYIEDMFGSMADVDLQTAYDNCRIKAEVNLLKSVLLNLVDNAYKASVGKTSVTIEVSGRKMEDGYLFSVKDYGVGIPEEECKKITEAFYMVDKSRSRSKNGAGLGLALCTEILKLHNTELTIESKVGEGSTFSFFLPNEVIKDDKTQKAD